MLIIGPFFENNLSLHSLLFSYIRTDLQRTDSARLLTACFKRNKCQNSCKNDQTLHVGDLGERSVTRTDDL